MSEYHKIQTLFKRDMDKPGKPIILGAWTKPEFEYLKDNLWHAEEKIDGMNIRVEWDGENVKFGGRTDNALLPTRLVAHLNAAFTPDRFRLCEYPPMTLYGEGCGAGIQKGGGYSAEQRFVLFDVHCGGLWLEREDVLNIACRLETTAAINLGTFTLTSIIEKVCRGLQSCYGDFFAEGVIARPVVELQNRRGERIIAKIKHRDLADTAA